MSMPKAQQRPLSPAPKLTKVDEHHPFALWCAEPHLDARGTIQQPNDKGLFAYIRPDEFPEERLYFSLKDYPERIRKLALQGHPVVFDLHPQLWNPALNILATNVRLA